MKCYLSNALLFLPFLVFAQDDYCPCMEESYQDLMNMVNTSMDEDYLSFAPINSDNFVAEIKEETPLFFYAPDQEDTNSDSASNQDSAPSYSAGYVRKAFLKKTRKDFRPKIKLKLRQGKYKGQCPMF